MTPKQRREHVEALRAALAPIKCDNYGNYKTDSGVYRFKFKKLVIRLERSSGGGRWGRIASFPIATTTVETITARRNLVLSH